MLLTRASGSSRIRPQIESPFQSMGGTENMKLRGLVYAVMTVSVWIGALCASSAAQNPSAGGGSSVLGWALPLNPPPPPGQVRQPDPTAKHVPNSTVTY